MTGRSRDAWREHYPPRPLFARLRRFNALGGEICYYLIQRHLRAFQPGKEGTVKALSIHPYYAQAIVTGLKTIEVRTWRTDYRGDIVICSTAKAYK